MNIYTWCIQPPNQNSQKNPKEWCCFTVTPEPNESSRRDPAIPKKGHGAKKNRTPWLLPNASRRQRTARPSLSLRSGCHLKFPHTFISGLASINKKLKNPAQFIKKTSNEKTYQPKKNNPKRLGLPTALLGQKPLAYASISSLELLVVEVKWGLRCLFWSLIPPVIQGYG